MRLILLLAFLATITLNIGEAYESHRQPITLGIGAPDASAIMEMKSTTQGVLPPRMTTVQRDAIAAPAEGLVIYNTTTTALEIFSGGTWGATGGGGSDHPLWLVSTVYGIGGIVVDGLTFKVYRCNTLHTSDATLFATDLALGYWDELSDDLDRLTISVDNTLPRFDGVTGDLIQSSGVTISDTDVVGNVVGLAIGAVAPVASSLHDSVSTTQGSRPCPSMTEVQRDAIGTPASGLCVYNTTTNKLNIYNSSTTAWEAAGGGLNKWLTATAYAVDDVIWEPSSDLIYVCNNAHTSNVFATDIANWDELSKASFETVLFDSANEINGPVTHMDTLQKTYSHISSAGIMDGCDITDNADGTVSIALGVISLRTTADSHGNLVHVNLAASGVLALTDNTTNYLYIDYNAGSPQWAVSTSETATNGWDKVLGYFLTREGNELKIVDVRDGSVDLANKSDALFHDFARFIHKEGGTSIGSSGLNVTVSGGRFYHGISPIDHVAFDTSIGGTANENVFEYYYGSWTEIVDSKAIDNVQYDNAGTLTALGTGKWKVDWVYMQNDTPSSLAIIYGTTQYNNQASAELETVPSLVPPSIAGVGALIGRYLVQEGTATVIPQSVFTTTFAASGVTEHNSLSGLQGGAASEYYHLDATEFGFLDGQDQSVLTTGTPSFADLTIDNMYLNLNTFSTTAGDLTFAPFTSITNITGDLSVSGRIDGEGSKVLGNDAYKQFNKSAYAEYSVIGDFSTGQNATFDGGGTITAGEPSIEVGALDTTDANFYQYDMGAVNDYFYLTVPVDQDKTIGYRFRYSYDGADDDVDLEIKCATSGTILTDTDPMPVKKADELTTMTGSIFVPTGCGDLKFGFSVAVFNTGKVFKFNRLTLNDNPFVYKNLNINVIVEAAGNASTSLAVANVTEIDYIEQIDSHDAWDGSGFTAPFSGIYEIEATIDLNGAGSAHFTSFIDGAQVRRINGNYTSITKGISDTQFLNKGERYSIRTDTTGPVLNNSTLDHAIRITGLIESEHVVTPAKSTLTDWISYTPAITGFGTPPPANIDFKYRRIGDSIEIQGRFTSGSPTAVEAQLGLPSALTINNNKISLLKVVGGLSTDVSGSSPFNTTATGNDAFLNITTDVGASGIAPLVANSVVSPGAVLTFYATVPITGYSSDATFLAAIPVTKVAYLKDVKTSGTTGGTFTSGAWQTRTLNTVSGDSGIVSLSSNRFTLQSGKYKIHCSAPGNYVTSHKAKLVGDPGGTPFDAIIGTSEVVEGSASVKQTRSHVTGIVNITSATVYELQHRCSLTRATNGLGAAVTFGDSEIYTQCEITQIKAGK